MLPRGRVRRRIAGAAVALASALLAGEVTVRVASEVMPGVRYLATAGLPVDRPAYATLEDFLAAHSAHLIPHRAWFNYWNNSLGFNDREFEAPKPAGRFRIMALGDSFVYGLVPYPDNVLTRVEERVRTRCSCRDFDLLNFGIGATAVEDYGALVEVSQAIYGPDLIAVHFYMGNDGPDVHAALSGRRWRRRIPTSYASNYLRNAWRLRAARWLNAGRLHYRSDGHPPPSTPPRGGEVIDARQPPLTDRDPAIASPTFAEDEFLNIARAELFRLYAPKNRTADVERAWAPTIDALGALQRAAAGRGTRVAVVLFPSAPQVHAALRAQILEDLHAQGRFRDVELGDIDAALPNRMLRGYCRRANISCIDVTPALLDAGRQSTAPLYRARDTHWNIRGNHVAADAEAAALGTLLCQEPRFRC